MKSSWTIAIPTERNEWSGKGNLLYVEWMKAFVPVMQSCKNNLTLPRLSANPGDKLVLDWQCSIGQHRILTLIAPHSWSTGL